MKQYAWCGIFGSMLWQHSDFVWWTVHMACAGVVGRVMLRAAMRTNLGNKRNSHKREHLRHKNCALTQAQAAVG